MGYCFSKVIDTNNFNDVVNKVIEELSKEGFGILTEINVKDVLKEKINVDFKKYKILGACSPHSAYKVLQKEDKAGVFLPCNVVITEIDDNKIEVFAIDPIAAMKEVDNNTLGCHLIDIQQKLRKVIDKV